MTENLPRLLTVAEVLQALRIGRTTLYQLVIDGDLPRPIKLGSKSLWLESDVTKYLHDRIAEREALPL